MKFFFSLMIFMIGVSCASLSLDEKQPHNYKPTNGYVSNETVAIKIAEAVLETIYGEETVNMEKPLNAELVGNIWRVTGTLNCPKGEICIGGVAIIEISKKEGTIYRVSHGE